MQFTTIFTIAALALGSNAAVIQRADPHITDFRTYGETGCYNQNQGVYTFTQSQLNACNAFVDTTVASMFVVDINAGCEVSIYSDIACSSKVVDISTNGTATANCFNYEAGLGSYQVTCSS